MFTVFIKKYYILIEIRDQMINSDRRCQRTSVYVCGRIFILSDAFCCICLIVWRRRNYIRHVEQQMKKVLIENTRAERARSCQDVDITINFFQDFIHYKYFNVILLCLPNETFSGNWCLTYNYVINLWFVCFVNVIITLVNLCSSIYVFVYSTLYNER